MNEAYLPQVACESSSHCLEDRFLGVPVEWLVLWQLEVFQGEVAVNIICENRCDQSGKSKSTEKTNKKKKKFFFHWFWFSRTKRATEKSFGSAGSSGIHMMCTVLSSPFANTCDEFRHRSHCRKRTGAQGRPRWPCVSHSDPQPP